VLRQGRTHLQRQVRRLCRATAVPPCCHLLLGTAASAISPPAVLASHQQSPLLDCAANPSLSRPAVLSLTCLLLFALLFFSLACSLHNKLHKTANTGAVLTAGPAWPAAAPLLVPSPVGTTCAYLALTASTQLLGHLWAQTAQQQQPRQQQLQRVWVARWCAARRRTCCVGRSAAGRGTPA
jgi:hypothetical protein